MLYLVRHGESAANAGGLLLGRTDSPLTELGRRQAAATGRLLAVALSGRGDVAPLVISSPLERARASAALLAGSLTGASGGGPEVVIDERAIELDYGDLEGVPVAEVPADIWAAWRADPAWRPPGGESLTALSERVVPLLEELAPAARRDDVIVVSHVSPIKAGVAWSLGVGIEVSWRLSLGVASVTRVSLTGGRPALASYGETAHLAEL